MSEALNHLINGESELFKKSIETSLYSKVAEVLADRRKQIAAEMFSEEECSSCGEQIEEKKDFAALAPPYDKPTYADKIAGARMSAKNKNKGKK
jgi:hypothetical protein